MADNWGDEFCDEVQKRKLEQRIAELKAQQEEYEYNASCIIDTKDKHIAELEALVRDMMDEDECVLDHNGHCQQHNWFGDGECPDKRAKELMLQSD